MAQNAFARIADRTRLAETARQGQGALARAWSGMGLGLANAMDRFGGVFKSPASSFMAGGLHGAMKGAWKGFFLAIIGIALFGTAVVSGLTMVMVASGVGALLFGAYSGQRALDHNVTRSGGKAADFVAKKTGAIPKADLAKTDYPGEILELSSDRREGFADREKNRRTGASHEHAI